MENINEQIVTMMFMDLVEHDLLTMEEMKLAKEIYLKNEKNRLVANEIDEEKTT